MRNGFQTLIQVVQTDREYDLSFMLEDSTGSPLDLTDSTLTFIAQIDSNYKVNFTGAMTIVDASGGRCKYTVQPTDFSVAGTWNVQVQVAYTGGEVLTFSNIVIQVAAKLPIS